MSRSYVRLILIAVIAAALMVGMVAPVHNLSKTLASFHHPQPKGEKR